jgi:hypothetical protein
MAPSQAINHAEIGLVVALRLRAEATGERYQGPTDRRAKMLLVTASGEARADTMPCSLNAFSAASSLEAVQSAASEDIQRPARIGTNRPRCSLPRAHMKACLLGENFGQIAGIA